MFSEVEVEAAELEAAEDDELRELLDDVPVVELLLNDCISMSIHVAEMVEVVPNMLKPLSSFPLGSYNVLEIFE